MYGYSFLLNGDNMTFKTEGVSGRAIQYKNCLCFNNMIDKFDKDKVFYENEKYLLVLDGVVLNRKHLVDTSDNTSGKADSWAGFLIGQYEAKGDSFFDVLRGSFSGILYDKFKDHAIAFTDHIGSKFIYYIHHGDSFFVSSMISECYAFLKQNSIPYSLSRDNAYLLLSYGYMLEDRTLCDKIKKIEPGCYLTFDHGNMEQHQYCFLTNEPDRKLTEQDAIEIYDEEFRRAIKLQFDKDEEYGYKHLVALSAGLDSRMVSWVAHEMGYTRQLNATFSQTGYWDQTIPQQIAADLKHDWIFKALDGGWWLENFEAITKVTGGNVVYYALAHSSSLTDLINYEQLGLVHSGQLGDAVFATGCKNRPYQFGRGAYSNGYLDRIKNIQIKDYPNEEIGFFYTRCFNGANNGILNNFNNTEFISPWHDIDLLQRILSIPLDMRFNHNLYFKWILKKYPKAADYVWEKMGTRFNRKFGMIPFSGHKIPIEKIPKKIIGRLGFTKDGLEGKNHMNPFGYYINTNIELNKKIELFIHDTIVLVDDKLLKEDITTITKSVNSLEKIQALSLLSALKMFF